MDPAAILRRGRATGESIARLGTQGGKTDEATGNVSQLVLRSGCVLSDGQGMK